MRLLFFILWLYCAGVAMADVNASDSAKKEQPLAMDIQRYFPALSANAVAELISEGRTLRYYYQGESAALRPSAAMQFKADIFEGAVKQPFNLNIEQIIFVPVTGLHIDENPTPTNPQLLHVYNTLRAISSLTGVEYYSASRQTMRTLFEAAYVVASEKTPVKISDPIVTSVPPYSELVIFQKDLTFGENLSRLIYRNAGNHIALSLTNLTDLRYGIFPVVRKGNMHTTLVIMPVAGGVIIYGNISVATLHLLGLEKTKKASFYHRLNSLFDWFASNMQASVKAY